MLAALAIAPAVAAEVRASVEVADISGLAVSPDGQWLAFRVERPSIVRNAIETAWYVVPTRSGAPRRIADGGRALISGAGGVVPEMPLWSPRSQALYLRIADEAGVQLWRAGMDGMPPTRLTREAGDVAQVALAEDGRSLRYSVDLPRAERAEAEARAREDGIKVDHQVDLAIGAVGGGRYLGREQSVRTTGRWFERRPVPEPRVARHLALPVHDAGAPVSGEAIAAAPDAKRDAVLCAEISCDSARLGALRLGDGRLLVTRSAEDGGQSLWLGAPGTGFRQLAQSRGQLSGGRDRETPCAVARTRIFCVAASADLPPRLIAIDLESGSVQVVHAPNAALARRTRGQARRVQVKAGARLLSGLLILPRSPKPARGYPIVISYYRCDGFLRGGVGDELPIWPLQSAGIATLCLNQAVIEPDARTKLAELRIAQVGVANAVRQLARQGLVDRSRVGMHGLSFGSEAAMWVAGHSRLLAAVSIASGQLEPSFYWTYALPGRDVTHMLARFWGLGDPERAAGRWPRLSPARFAHRIRAPVLMQLPELEARWSIELHAKLARSATPVELYVFPGAAHVKAEPRQKASAYARNLAWFCRWLLADAPSTAAGNARDARRGPGP